VYAVSQRVTMDSALEVLNEGRRVIDSGENDFSLAAMADSDSSAVAVLLSWQRRAAKVKRTLHFHDLPSQLVAIADLYGVTEFLSGFPAPRHHSGSQPLV
jgi:phospholipid transport system transporter-binding protein